MNGFLPRTKQCFFCGRTTNGLCLELQYLDGGTLCQFTPPEVFQGFGGILHGGIITGILDEVMFWAVLMETQKICVTVKIETVFKRPIFCGRTYRASGRLLHTPYDTDYFAQGTITDESGKNCATGKASFHIMRGMTIEDMQKDLIFTGISREMRSLFYAPKNRPIN